MIVTDLFESHQTCPKCGGPAFSDLVLAEKKDACYSKVRSRYKVWPSAYASGALVQCRKKGAANWGNKSESKVYPYADKTDVKEFAPDSSGDDGGDDGFSEETLKKFAAQWYNGDEDPQVEKTLMAAGWEIGHDEGYDDEPGVFVVQAGDINGHSFISWPANELRQGVAEGNGRLNEFAPSASGGSGDYFQALASAWYNGAFDTGSLEKGIKSKEDVERLLNRGIIGPDGVTRKYAIDYNSTFEGVVISSDDYYEHSDYNDQGQEVDSRNGRPWGPYDYMEFDDEELDESAKWRDPKYKGQLYTQEPPDYNDTREYDNARFNPKPKGYAGRKELPGGGEYDRTDPLRRGQGIGRSGIKNNINLSGKRKGLPSRDQITSLKGSIKDAHGTHTRPNLPEQGVAEGAKWRSNPNAHDINDDGDIYPKTRDMFAYDPLTRRQSTAGDARTARGKKSALKTSLKMAQGRHGPKSQLPEEQGVAEAEQQPGANYRNPREVDYDGEYDAMVARVKRLAGLGPLKTVYDPAKRVYRNMPIAQQPKK